ncbi:TPA: CHAT domain-containing protein [Proteus mirabilis]|nr:CHAT domain-containing protein [Proteus mirabilis]
MNKNSKHLNSELLEFDPFILFSTGFNLGSMDIIQGGNFKDVIGRTPTALWCGLPKKTFDGILVILPPKSATSLTHVSVMNALYYGIETLKKGKLTEEEITFLENIVHIIHGTSLDAIDLIDMVRDKGNKQLIAIPEINKYRDNRLPPQAITGLSVVFTSQDIWTRHVESICRQVMVELKKHDAYAVVHIDDSCILSDKNNEILTGIDDCYVACLSFKNDKKELVDQHAQRWVTQIMGGLTDQVLAEIESLNLPEINRLHLLAQLYSRANKCDEVIRILTHCLDYYNLWDKESLIQLASIAHKIENKPLVKSLLPKDANGLASHNWLEKALDLATYLHDDTLIEMYDQAMELLFPNSESLRENRDRRLLINCSLTHKDKKWIFTTAGFSQYHLTLQSELFSETPIYSSIVEAANGWGNEWAQLAAICCCTHANSLGNPRDAADVASLITTSAIYGRQATLIVLSSLRKIMLVEAISYEEHDHYRILLQSVIRYLANYPNDEQVRQQLTELLSVESCGEIGVPAITLTMLDIASEQSQNISPSQNEEQEDEENNNLKEPDYNTLMEYLERILVWVSAQCVVENGVTVLPSNIVESPDSLIRLITRIINYAAPEKEDIDLNFMEKMVSVVCMLTPHAKYETNMDLRVLRLLGGQFAAASQFQHARNYAEQALLLGSENAERKRLAWLAYSDIYQRCNDPLQAIYSLACAFATNASTTPADMWQEFFAASRILRDLGLLDHARSLLPTLRLLLQNCGADPDTDPRMLSIEESINLCASTSEDPSIIARMLSRLTEGCLNASGNRSDLMPLIIQLSQVIRRADYFHVVVSDESRRVLSEGLEFLGSQVTEFISTVSDIEPTVESVVQQFNLIEKASYSSDISKDYAMITVAARRLLNDQVGVSRPVSENALAIEILADHSVSSISKPVPLHIDWLVNYSRELNTLGADILFLGLDTSGELVVIHISQDKIERIEQPVHSRSFKNRMLTWLEEYPYKYGAIDSFDGNNEFFAAMESLDIKLPMAAKLLIIAEPELQQITFNLSLVKSHDECMGDFLGYHSAIAMVPSLTWLASTRQNYSSVHSTRKSWISHQDNPDGGGAMGVALRRLEGTFDEFNFTLDTMQRIPDLSSAEIAVVVAHGGLTRVKRYIHRISDEEMLVEAPTALANALADSDVVILFVCSGGRIDKNPWSNTTVGLPKLLLSRGVKAVIASPWPLDVKVTYNWLEPFLTAWDSGASLFDSTKAANEATARNLGKHPQYSLAMTIYGDGFLTKS